MKIRPAKPEAYKLLHQGTITLAQVESNGMRVDEKRLEQTIRETDKIIKQLESQLRKDDLYSTWRKVYGQSTQLGSREQLGKILFNVLKYPCVAYTKTGRPKADDNALSNLGLPFVTEYLKLEKMKKMRGTYLEGIRRELVDGFLHPFFNLHTARTYRSSSSEPNFQNLPIRNAEISKIIRSLFVPRPGRHVVEIDYGGIEVKVSTCYNKDPNLIKYVTDKTTDMHRDMAAECYMIKPEQVSKLARYAAKNQFVFPQFYGSYYAQCAPALWQSIDKLKLEVDGKSLRTHLRGQGIKSLGLCDGRPQPGTFENHIKQVEEDFWGRRFKVYAEWKKTWWEAYQKEGGFHMLTGFRVQGVYSRNDVINYPVQGAAFHCLLQSLIWLQRWLTKKKMKSLIVGQIHDSMVLDVVPEELEDVLYVAKWLMTKKLPKAWPWIIVPLEVECEVAPINASWHEKKKVEL